MATTRIMPLHVGKGRTESRAISDIIDYVANPKKTDNGRLITGYACDSRTADAEFLLAKRQYIAATGRVRGTDDVIAYHVRQSFRPGEITPEEANRLGVEFAKRFTKGNHAFVVCTHIDKSHIHNHIIFNSTSLDCTDKFRNFFFVGLALQRLSDIICLEHGLSVIEKKKPSERVKRTTYPDKKSFRDDIRDAIDWILKQGSAKDFDELLYKLEDAGYEIKCGKHISLKEKIRNASSGFVLWVMAIQKIILRRFLLVRWSMLSSIIKKLKSSLRLTRGKRKIMSLTSLSIFKRRWLRAKENIMSALPRTLIQSRWLRQFYI